ncbi:MAG: hypothetical protein K0M45_08695 [Candidatus Paracaedibacteraceae bacterium]|nr:hypothetical protein [Candidatus Paracaedibacteraceae bacterium]
MNTLPYCFFPTTVISIGNTDNTYIKNIYQDSQQWISPPKALDMLIKTQTVPLLFDRLTAQAHDVFDLSSINYLYEEIYNPCRDETVSCVVYQETTLTQESLSFLQKLDQLPAKKILVTQARDEKTVVSAFNEGLINFYVCTQNPDAASLLEEFIQQSQAHYFRDGVNALVDPLLEKWQRENNTLPTLSDPVFMEFLQNFMKRHRIIEHYLLDITGSFLLLDHQGQTSALFVFNEQSFAEQGQAVDRFLQSNHSLSARIVEDLKNRCQTICFPFIYPQEVVHFDPYIEPVQILDGQQRYYIAYSKSVDYLGSFLNTREERKNS